MNIYTEIDERQKVEALDILEKLLNNESVKRWDALQRRFLIRQIMDKTDKYDEIEHELNLIIDMAKESL